MIGKSFHEIELEIGRLITENEFKTVVQTKNYRSIIVNEKKYEYFLEE